MTGKTSEVLEQAWVKEFLARPLLARLGTANPKNAQPHVTPVWFEWDGECLYISAFVSTRKGKEVTANQRISVLIDVDNPTFAVLLEGRAEVLTEPTEVARRSESIYTRYVGEQNVKGDPYQSWAHDPENRIIKLRPAQAYAWKW
jgi:nitroimidazol reductase NimA-like FMN-containing flavoprotein (pyridoxamine 5'-phosphate oxidase superfamily)